MRTHHMDHTLSPMLEPQSHSDINVHYEARIQIQTRGGSGWLQLNNVINMNCTVNRERIVWKQDQRNEKDGSTEFIISFTGYRL